MGILDQLWDDVLAGPSPEKGLGKLRKLSAKGETRGKYQQSVSMPGTPASPSSPVSPGQKANVWRSVFNPGSNPATKSVGADLFDKPNPNSPTIYDWMYSKETRSSHR